MTAALNPDTASSRAPAALLNGVAGTTWYIDRAAAGEDN
jgi:hypothetical protein